MIIKKKVSYTSNRFVNLCKKKMHLLTLELDYELASLSHAIKINDEKEISNCKDRLKNIHTDIDTLKLVLNPKSEWS